MGRVDSAVPSTCEIVPARELRCPDANVAAPPRVLIQIPPMPMRRFLTPFALAALLGCPAPATVPAAPEPAPAATDAHTDHAPADDEHAGHEMEAGADHSMHDLPPVTLPQGSLVTEADVRFMQMMIGHHAQAVYMTRMAEAAGASDRVLKLAHKIDLSQAGEIALMQGWLVDYGQHARAAATSTGSSCS